ncbi:hypothetical protein NQ314_004104 [Rhamnusium bicolor]|uniref:Major facilitator superfamily (MFS) profile domain-containing protein n=1 Tax=Rhamnusium bicolor TaxID=1586634 RepID=A0AAV8ZK93_9CUCU|nr:hypothetical protein NQ314_004104 [Rhamnusium bicolor]
MSKENVVLDDIEKFPSYGTTNEVNKEEAPHKNDDLLKATIGDFGKWQFKISILMALLKFPIAWFSLSIEGLNSGYCAMKDIENNPINTIPCLDGYSYNRTVFHSSIISEWDLTFFGIVASFTPWYWGFIFARFLLAISNGGTVVTSFVMCMEVVGGKWRTIVPILYQIPFGFGNSIMAGLAYVIRDWRQFHFTLSALSSLYILYIWCIPESPRWLLAVGRKEEAMAILQRAAVCNKIDPAKIAIAMTDLTICGITFYAFSQYLGHVSTNIYFTVAVGGLIALPGTVFCVLLVARCGRRMTIAVAHLVTAVCFLAILAVPKGAFVQDWPRVAFAATGIIGISSRLYDSAFDNYPSRSKPNFAPNNTGSSCISRGPVDPASTRNKRESLPETVEDLENFKLKLKKEKSGGYVLVPKERKDAGGQ